MSEDGASPPDPDAAARAWQAAPYHYADFIQDVRRYRPSALLSALAAIPIEWNEPSEDQWKLWSTFNPWTTAAIARESLLHGNDHRTGVSVRLEDVTRLQGLCAWAHDNPPVGSSTDTPLAIMGRTAFEQFSYQESDAEEVARTRALFDSALRATDAAALTPADIEQLLGGRLDAVVGSAIIIWGLIVSNAGQWDDRLLDSPDLGPLYEQVPKDTVLCLRREMTATQAEFKADAAMAPTTAAWLQRYGYNPLHRTPLIKLPDGRILAPQPRLILRRVAPTALYYAGMRRFGKSFADALGGITQTYVGQQLSLIEGARVLPEIRFGSPEEASIDWFVITPAAVLLVEVKAARLTAGARAGDFDLGDKLRQHLDRAQRQIDRTAELIRGRHPAFADIPTDRPLVGLTVTAEPFYTANMSFARQILAEGIVPTLVASLRDLEQVTPHKAADVGAAVLKISTDPELSRWALWTSLRQQLPHLDNPILRTALDAYPPHFGDDPSEP